MIFVVDASTTWKGSSTRVYLRFALHGPLGSGSQRFWDLVRLLVVIPTGISEQVWVAEVWPALLDMASWPGLLVLLAVPLASWFGRGLRDWQEHLKVKMILRNSVAGTVVVSQTRHRRSSSTLLVRVGGDDVVPTLVEGRTR